MAKRLIAFDFDGVICDGQAEYFYSAALGYRELWQPKKLVDLEKIRPKFYALRPIIETGWEMIVLIEALLSGTPEGAIWQDWRGVIDQILEQSGINQQQLAVTLDQVRDRQISEQLDQWLDLHRFYDGILECLQKLVADTETDVYIITTKEARFTHQILQQQGINFPRENIFGKEAKQPKTATLKQLISPELENIWFIEDRLKTLEKVQQDPALSDVKLFLADWGYNTESERIAAAEKGIAVVNPSLWTEQIGTLIKSQTFPLSGED
ncbi:MAG: HAD family hydrolase [Limnothrix sp. RL_2_0]|nr:HAD family hydrolase [Limnothrix sp. RL_2_0]